MSDDNIPPSDGQAEPEGEPKPEPQKPPEPDWKSIALQAQAELERARQDLAHRGADDAALQDIAQAEAEVAEAEKELERAKKVQAAKKAAWEEAVSSLRQVIREARDGYPLFGKEIPEAPKAPEPPAAPEEPATLHPDGALAWRGVLLSALIHPDGTKLSRHLLDALAENEPPLLTMGDVSDWCQRNGTRTSRNPLTLVKGIGDGKAERITDAMSPWYELNPDGVPKPAPEPEVPAAPEPPAPPAESKTEADPVWLSSLTVLTQDVLVELGKLGMQTVADVEAYLAADESRALIGLAGLTGAMVEAIGQAIAERHPATSEEAEAKAWQLVSVLELVPFGLDQEVAERMAAVHVNVGILALYAFRDNLASVPGGGPQLDRQVVLSALDAFRAKLPNDQAFDFEGFVAECVPGKPAPEGETPAEGETKPPKRRKKGAA